MSLKTEHLLINPVGIADVADIIGKAQKGLTGGARVDIVGIGDSNQVQSGFGWDHGIGYSAETRKIPVYGTSLMGTWTGGGSSDSQGYKSRMFPTSTSAQYQSDYSTLPSALRLLVFDNISGMQGVRPWYFDKTAFTSGNGHGLVLFNGHPIDPATNALRFDYYYGKHSTLNAAHPIRVRRNNGVNDVADASGYAAIVSGTINHTSDGDGTLVNLLRRKSLSMAAGGNGGKDMNACIWQADGSTATNPTVFLPYQRVVAPGITMGIGYSQLVFYASNGLKNMAISLGATGTNASIEALGAYFDVLRQNQLENAANGGKAYIVIAVNSGVNDRNDATASLTGNLANGNTAQGYLNNLEAIRLRIEAVWEANNWDKNEIYWVITPSHRYDTGNETEDTSLTAFRGGLTEWCKGKRACGVNLAHLHTRAQMNAGSYWAGSTTSSVHLTQAGYEQVMLALSDHLIGGPVAAFNTLQRLRTAGVGYF